MNTTQKVSNKWLIMVLAVLFTASLVLMSAGNVLSGGPAWQIIINVLLVSIPLLLLYGSIGLLVIARQQRRNQGRLSKQVARLIDLVPRLAGTLIVLYIALFGLDVFGMAGSFWQQLLAFVMHSLPAILLAVLLVFAWRWPAVGFFAYLLGGIFFLVLVFDSLPYGLSLLLTFSAPMIAIALLFLASWKWRQPSAPA